MVVSETRLAELLDTVERAWRGSLERFIRTNEMSEEFALHLDECPLCQAAVNEILDAEEKGLHDLGVALRKPKKDPECRQLRPVAARVPAVGAASARAAALSSPPSQQTTAAGA
jgi:hypothetical protein